MTHLYKIENQFADIFIKTITKENIIYEVRDKITGVLMEPERTAKYYIDELQKKIHYDERYMSFDLFNRAYSVLNADSSL